MMIKLQIIVKQLIDKIFSGLGLLLMLPVMAAISIAIKLSDEGPVFFTQNRLGKDGKVFRIIKFRSMVVDADKYLNEKGESSNDRITPIGRFLRKTSLDEIPQLLNIVKGEMSIIGPRPTLTSHWDRYTEKQKGRFAMRPGVTGWAQVCGRNNIPWSRRIELDIEYINNYSFWFDVKIFFKTLKVVFTGSDISIDRNASVVDDLGESKTRNKQNGCTK